MRFSTIVAAGLLAAISSPAIGQQPAAQSTKGATKQLAAADLKAWKTIRQTTLSNDGKWLVYVIGPNEGDATLVVRSTGTDGKETKFPVGDVATGGGGLTVSADSRWVAYTIAPPASNGRGGRGAGRGGAGAGNAAAASAAPTQNKMGLVNLATGEKKEFEKVRRFAFNGDKPTWIAMQNYPDTPAPAATAAPAGGRSGAAGAGGASVTGTDLVLYNLSNSDAVNVGNVADFSFDESGDWLAYTIDARSEERRVGKRGKAGR